MRALLPSTSSRTDILEADMLPRKRACLIGENFTAGAARQPRPALEYDPPTTLEGVNQRVTELDTTVRQRTEEFVIRFEETQDDRAFLRARVNTLFRDIPFHRHTVLLLDREETYARRAWASSKDRNLLLQTQLTTTLGRIKTLKARDPEPQDEPSEAGSNC
nr:hypothetical protein [Tanacetum cinerariifolium]